MQADQDNNQPTEEAQGLPFVAPCRELEINAPFRWLKLGWQDLKSAPRQSLTYGLVMLLISYLISFIALEFGNFYMLLSLMSGFIFLGPVIAIGLYSVSCQLQIGLNPVLGYCLREGRRHMSNEAIFAFLLLIVFLVWARAASVVHIFFPMNAEPELVELMKFLLIITGVGTIFAAIIFSASAFSLPMIMDRKADMITAVITSVNAVLRNKKVMLVWALIIAFTIVISFLTAFIGLVVLLPLIGHATWHAYQETIDASAWPRHD